MGTTTFDCATKFGAGRVRQEDGLLARRGGK